MLVDKDKQKGKTDSWCVSLIKQQRTLDKGIATCDSFMEKITCILVSAWHPCLITGSVFQSHWQMPLKHTQGDFVFLFTKMAKLTWFFISFFSVNSIQALPEIKHLTLICSFNLEYQNPSFTIFQRCNIRDQQICCLTGTLVPYLRLFYNGFHDSFKLKT